MYMCVCLYILCIIYYYFCGNLTSTRYLKSKRCKWITHEHLFNMSIKHRLNVFNKLAFMDSVLNDRRLRISSLESKYHKRFFTHSSLLAKI